MRSIKALEALAALAWLVASLAAVAGTRANRLFVVDIATRGRGGGGGGGWGVGDEGGPYRPNRPRPRAVLQTVPSEPDLPPAEEIPSADPDVLIGEKHVPARPGPRGRQAAIAHSQAASALLPRPGAEGDPASELSGGMLGPLRPWPPGCEPLTMQPPAASALPTRPGAEGDPASELSGGMLGPLIPWSPGCGPLTMQSPAASALPTRPAAPCGFPLDADACAALCPRPVPPGYRLYLGLGLYKAHFEKRTWIGAKAACEREGAHLVVINSESEAIMVSTLLKTYAGVKYYHVGFMDVSGDGTYITVLGYPLWCSGYNVWAHGEPNNVGKENCGAIDERKGLNDMDCLSEHSFLCELPQ